ncbi:hypothetical protein VNO78_34981 [Psophocarpus tetragonolobus]|uniref:Uncharacterized protein n=1 Tax=Psophocarpus tetragonolobus TaxID=3891 RepID=A0AAN9RM03_PSOTE
MREVNQSKFVQAVRGRFQTPSTKFIIKTSLAFLVLGVFTVLFPTEEGPTLQVAISLIATMYFIHDRLKSKFRVSLYGYVAVMIGAFGFSWLLGTNLLDGVSEGRRPVVVVEVEAMAEKVPAIESKVELGAIVAREQRMLWQKQSFAGIGSYDRNKSEFTITIGSHFQGEFVTEVA